MRMSDNNGLTIIFVFSCYIFFDYKFFGFSVEIFTIVIALQVAFILLAFSDFGAYLLRLVLGSHELNLEEQEKLLPLFEEVYEEVRKEYPKVNKEIKLYIDSDMNINAYAVGSNTITITRGAYLSLRDAEIKGIFAHEFAHIIHGDTFLLLVLLIGNSIGGISRLSVVHTERDCSFDLRRGRERMGKSRFIREHIAPKRCFRYRRTFIIDQSKTE